MSKFVKNCLSMVSVFMLVVGLSACASKPVPEPVFVPPPAKPTLNEIRSAYIERLTARGVQIIHVGETIRLVVPDDYLFAASSANLVSSYLDVLRDITLLMNTYDMVDVKVSGYLDNQLSPKVAKALSTRQAQVVLNKLRYYGIDTRFLYAVGKGQLNPVAWNGSPEGRFTNRRVEIYFHYYPKTKGYN